MNNKTKIITSAAAAFGLAVGTAGVIGYRNIDEQWKEFDNHKKQTEQEHQQTLDSLTSQKANLLQRELTAQKELQEARNLFTAAEDKKLSASRETKLARELERNSQQAIQVTLEKQRQLQVSQKKLNNAQLQAERMLAQHSKARNLAEKESEASKKLQASLAHEINVARTAEAKAKKAESTTVWYQNKAKKLISQAECDIAEANRTHCQAIEIRSKAERVFHKIDKLEDLIDNADEAYAKLENDHRRILCEYNDLKSHRRADVNKINKLNSLNREHCATIEKQKSALVLLRKDTKKAQQLRQLERANADKYHRLAKEHKSQAIKADNEAKTQKSIVSKQRNIIKKLQEQLKKK